MRRLTEKGCRAVAAIILLTGGWFTAGAAPPGAGPRSYNEPPVLDAFSVREAMDGSFVFEGQVSDEYPEECLIQFGGALQGYCTICGYDGSFSFCIELGPYDGGEVTAQAVDNVDQHSNILRDVVFTNRKASRP